ncbi:hypothetical protein BZA77DRAFT_97697 [Pyronema omphalodes]|nr:hypothetical protein BZA77DRAFT_97697 [Pyronema omphalodes]
MSRLQQDTFIDEDEEECCPLCVEEFDVQDRNFRPCPCGYQICQFCFNNIRSNLNGLCPACRRPYRDETIEYKIITAEELKAEDAKKKRAANEKRKHEAAKREIELLNRKHLSGLRVIQRNLVYVTGLNPTVKEDELLQTLRGHSYFGQYGKILKIVVNKRTAQERHGQMQSYQHDSQGLGVYVTFSSKEEAERCIKSVDNTDNGGRTLRATYGTTKYCSAYLRNEACPNKSCMFLHEPGEEAESFSRLELSNANTSRQNNQTNTREQQQPYGHQPQPSRPPPREHHHPPTLTHHDSSSSLTRASASHGASSSGGDDGHSALPSTANWAKNPPTPASRPASLVHSLSNNHLPPKVSTPAPKEVPPSPLSQKVQTARKAEDSKKTAAERTKPTPQAASTPSKTPPPAADKKSNAKSVGVIGQPAPAPEPKKVVAPPPPPPVQEPEPEPAPRAPTPAPKPKRRAEPITPNYLADHKARMTAMQKAMTEASFKFILDLSTLSEKEIEVLEKLAPMFDSQGGRKRRLREKQQAKKAQPSDSGSDDIREPVQQQPIGAINPPPMSIPARGLTPLQHQQLMAGEGSAAQRQAMALQESLQQAGVLRSQTPHSILQQMAGQQGFNNFQNSQGPMAPPQGHGHTRQSSRYTFANENPLAGTNVNARSNAAHMAEQQRMMPSQQGLPHQQLAQMYGGAPGLGGSLMGTAPPPGLKSAPTPPAPGLGGIPMGNMPGLGQFSNMGLKTESENILLKELLSGSASRLGGMRGVDGKRNVPLSARGNPGYTNRGGVVENYGDPSILQARVAQQPPSMQHQQNLQAGHGQPGGYNPSLNYYVSAQASGRW